MWACHEQDEFLKCFSWLHRQLAAAARRHILQEPTTVKELTVCVAEVVLVVVSVVVGGVKFVSLESLVSLVSLKSSSSVEVVVMELLPDDHRRAQSR